MLFRRGISARLATIFPSRRQFVLALVMGTMSVMLTLGVAETACRLLDLPVRYRVPRAEDVTATFDGDLGWAYIPNRSVVSSFGVPPRRIPSHFDDIGARVRAPGVTHDPAAPTVLLVGDSLTMGHGVVFDETFAGRLEATADLPYQVVNLGVQAFGTDQAFADRSAPLAANQGLYNGFLVAGLVWGLIAADPIGFQVKVFFLACVVVAGLYGAATVSRRILVVQALPAALALVAVVVAANIA
jgi:putative membrane protein